MASMGDRPGTPLPRTISYSRVVDLSHVIHPDIPCWPGDPPINIRAAAAVETEGYRLNAVFIGEHSGTHLNAAPQFFRRWPGRRRLSGAIPGCPRGGHRRNRTGGERP